MRGFVILRRTVCIKSQLELEREHTEIIQDLIIIQDRRPLVVSHQTIYISTVQKTPRYHAQYLDIKPDPKSTSVPTRSTPNVISTLSHCPC